MSTVCEPVWVDENEPDNEFKKPLIDEVLSKVKRVQGWHPDWTTPTIRFGCVTRGEMQPILAGLNADKIALGRGI